MLFDTPEFIEGYEGFMKIVEMGGSGLSTDEAVNPNKEWFDFEVAPLLITKYCNYGRR